MERSNDNNGTQSGLKLKPPHSVAKTSIFLSISDLVKKKKSSSVHEIGFKKEAVIKSEIINRSLAETRVDVSKAARGFANNTKRANFKRQGILLQISESM